MSDATHSIFETKFSDNAIISFDLFDTLIESCFFNQEDLFELMNPEVDRIIGQKHLDFKKVRILAEKIAHKNSQSESIDLNHIYEEIGKIAQLEKSQIMEIEKLELCYVQKFFQVKPLGTHMFQIAKSLNKKLVIIAETGLPRFFIESLLERFNYEGHQELFISSEIGLSKKTGKLYTHIADKMFCDPKYFLHVGSREQEDIQVPQQLGFNVLPIYSNTDSYKNSFYYKNIWAQTEESSIFSTNLIHGLLAKKFHETKNQESLNTDKSAFNQDVYRVGYFGLGPLLLGYIQWIIQKSQEDYIKHLYFSSNHGQFIRTAYDIIARHYSFAPTSYDLLSSSKICNLNKLTKPYELFLILDEPFSNISVQEYFLSNFDIDLSEKTELLDKYLLTKDTIIEKKTHEKHVYAILESILEELKTKALNEKDYYAAYLKYQNLPNPDKSAIVDIGYEDNIQSTLSDIAKQKIGGYYLVTSLDTIEKIKRNGMPISGYLGNFEENIYENSLEIIFSAIDKSFMTFQLNGNMIDPIFSEEEFNDSTKQFISVIQNAALDFIDDFEQTYNKHIPQFYFSPKQISKPIYYFLNQKTESAKVFKGVSLEKKLTPKSQQKELNILNALDNFEGIGLMKGIERVWNGLKKAL